MTGALGTEWAQGWGSLALPSVSAHSRPRIPLVGRAFPSVEDLTQAQPAAELAHSSPLFHHEAERRRRVWGPGRCTGSGDVSGEEDVWSPNSCFWQGSCTSLSHHMVTEALGMQERAVDNLRGEGSGRQQINTQLHCTKKQRKGIGGWAS